MEPIVDEKPRVDDYMTGEVITVTVDETTDDVADRMRGKEGHSGFPVCNSEGVVVGFVSARDLLLADSGDTAGDVMSDELLVARPDMKLKNAGRVILRSGIQRLPVVDENGELVGILSSTDVVRSQIERTSTRKVRKLKRTLEKVHGKNLEVVKEKVNIETLIPTQTEVFGDELEGRQYEIQRELIEPLVVVRYGSDELIADGHHRVMAGVEEGVGAMDAYVIDIDRERIDLGLYEQSVSQGLESVSDINVIDYAQHPLIEKTRGVEEEE